MARTAISAAALTANSSTVKPTGVAGDSNGHAISLPAKANLEECFLLATVSTATTALTVKAGANPPALEGVQGDLTLSLAVGTHLVGPLSSGRFIQADGTLYVDYATAANFSAVALVHVPRTA